MLTTILAFAFVLGTLVFFHELGHFLVARACGVGVDVFSLGFGPRILGWKRGRTDYRISAVPLGGYVKMVGEDPGDEVNEADASESYTQKPVGVRIAIAFAGPFFNLVLAALIFIVFATTSGKYILTPVIAGVSEGSPAAASDITEGDRVLSINGGKVTSWEDVQNLITKSGADPVTLELSRNGETRTVTVVPQEVTELNIYGEEITRHVVGIRATAEHQPIGLLEGVTEGIKDTAYWCKLTVVILGKIITGDISPKTLGGPIKIAELSGDYAEQGPMALSIFIAVLSINLGIINLFPIPVLDGGHLVFYLIEAVRRKPLALRTRELAQQVGLVLLMLLMAFVIFNDIVGIVTNRAAGG
ncbi:MAG: RIP metalloprotease RseP [Proteobacteria bacterium]|nr:RIP metalloprotease RseP [Pseudomonadota bacterium]